MRHISQSENVDPHTAGGLEESIFADASFTACSAVTIALIEHSTGVVKGLLTSKSRIAKRNTSIARLELVSGQMAANMAKNLVAALRRWPIATVTVDGQPICYILDH